MNHELSHYVQWNISGPDSKDDRPRIFNSLQRQARVGKFTPKRYLAVPPLCGSPWVPPSRVAGLFRAPDHPACVHVGKINKHLREFCCFLDPPTESGQARPITCKAAVPINSVRNARDKPSISIGQTARSRTQGSTKSWRQLRGLEFRHKMTIMYAGIYRPRESNFRS